MHEQHSQAVVNKQQHSVYGMLTHAGGTAQPLLSRALHYLEKLSRHKQAELS